MKSRQKKKLYTRKRDYLISTIYFNLIFFGLFYFYTSILFHSKSRKLQTRKNKKKMVTIR